MSDLSALFPDLPAEILNDFDAAGRQYQSNAPLQVGGEQAQVTDDQIAAYLHSVGSLRAPLPPVVSGQQTPSTPQFVNNGRQAPSPDSAYVEPPDIPGNPPNPPNSPESVQAPTNPYTSQPPVATEQTPLPVSPQTPSDLPPSPPAAPLTAPAAPTFPPTSFQDAPGAPESPPLAPESPPSDTRLQQMEALVGLWDADPQLRNIVAGYLTTGQAPAPVQADIPPAPPYAGGQPSPQQPYYPPPQPAQPYPQYPPPQAPSPYDQYGNLQQYPPPEQAFTDPTLRALYDQNAALQSRLDRLEQTQQTNAEQYNRSQMSHYEQIVESTVSKFGTDYALPPNILKSVRETAARIGAANTYMNGTHPVTGLPVRPDPHEAVKAALSIAYYATPQAQELERARTIQRANADAQRRQKLSGVGGSSASVPRTPPQPTTQAGRQDAMLNEMREMFNGSWVGPNNN